MSDHYNFSSIECIDYLESVMTLEEFRGYCRGNIIKYLHRLGKKDEPTKELKKAFDYLNWLMQSYADNVP